MTVEQHGYKTVKEFVIKKAEYEAYAKGKKKVEQATGGKQEVESVREKLKWKKEKEERQENQN